MEKYYTPELSEFYVGFEYEVATISNHTGKKGFGEMTFSLDFGAGNDLLDTYSEGYESTHLRVKRLDQEDIESFGLVKESEEGLPDVYRKVIDKDNWWLVMPHTLGLDQHCEVRVWQVNMSSRLAGGTYEGVIKNKSELKKILKGIRYE